LFTGCPQASGNGPATEQRAPAYPALLPFWRSWSAMGIELLSDESILRCYEQIRQQVAADLTTENRFRLMGGEAVKQRTERLRTEIDRRRLRCDPIEWGDLSDIRGTDPARKSPSGERD
jgi:hypothetical protein